VCFFLLTAERAVRRRGVLGFLATQSIAEATSSDVSIGAMQGRDVSLYRAVSSRPWPGASAVHVAELWLFSGLWRGDFYLDGRAVSAIDARLRAPGATKQAPERLHENLDGCLLGSKPGGAGFLLSGADALRLREDEDPAGHVVRPLLSGQDLANSPTCTATRFTIDFGETDLRQAKQLFPLCIAHLYDTVRIQRLEWSDARRREREAWWQFERRAVALNEQLRTLDHAIAIARVSKFAAPALISTDLVPNEKVAVVPNESAATFGVLASSFHHLWVLQWGTTMGDTLVYDPRAVFETFPRPPYDAVIEAAGKALDEHRSALMIRNDEGLTKTYNRVHNADDTSPGIAELRDLHVALDIAVRDAYGWSDLDLDHGFHDTPHGVRFTLGPTARTEVLDRLLELNHERYAAEVASGLHEIKKRGSRRGAVSSREQEPLL
jgi:hypothetical protein